jgi:hypothetical protein
LEIWYGSSKTDAAVSKLVPKRTSFRVEAQAADKNQILATRIPQPVWLLIFSVSLIAVFTRGSTLTTRFWLTLILLPITIALVVALIADLDTPSRGLIRLDQHALQRLKADVNVETTK